MRGLYLCLDDKLFEPGFAGTRGMTPPVQRVLPIFRNVANFSITVLPGYTAWIVKGSPARYTARASSPNGLNSWTPFQQVEGTLDKDFTNIIPGFRAVRRLAGNPPRWYGEWMESAGGQSWQSGGRCTPERYGETWRLFDLPGQLGLIHRWNRDHSWIDKEGRSRHNTDHDPTFTRCLGITNGQPQFPASRLLFAPDSGDSGETQFYGTSNIWQSGQLYLTLLHVLRDDLVAEGSSAYGTGYSTVAYSRDGLEWQRFREPLISPVAGSWSHAVAWGDCVLLLPDGTVRYYIGGYARGHKVFTDRSIGYAAGKKDRQVYATGRLRTPAFLNENSLLSVNIDGPLRVRVLAEDGRFLSGSGEIVANSINRQVAVGLGNFRGQRIRLEFLVEGKLYSFTLK